MNRYVLYKEHTNIVLDVVSTKLKLKTKDVRACATARLCEEDAVGRAAIASSRVVREDSTKVG